MYCRKCGRQLDDTWKTCPYCGEPVYAEQVGKEFLPETKNAGAAFYKKWWFWVIIAAVIVVIGVISVNNGELVPSARSNCTTLPKQEYRLAGWLYRSATALCQRCEPLFR